MYINNSLPLFLIYITQLLLITVLLYYCALVFYFIHGHWDFHNVPIQSEITSSSTLSTPLSTKSWSQNGVRPAHVTQTANQKWDMGWGNFSLSVALHPLTSSFLNPPLDCWGTARCTLALQRQYSIHTMLHSTIIRLHHRTMYVNAAY